MNLFHERSWPDLFTGLLEIRPDLDELYRIVDTGPLLFFFFFFFSGCQWEQESRSEILYSDWAMLVICLIWKKKKTTSLSSCGLLRASLISVYWRSYPCPQHVSGAFC